MIEICVQENRTGCDWRPRIGRRIVAGTFAPKSPKFVGAAYDDHLLSRPDRRMPCAPRRGAGVRNWRPGVGEGVIAGTVTERLDRTALGGKRFAAPDDHFGAGPHGAVEATRRGYAARVGGVRRGPGSG